MRLEFLKSKLGDFNVFYSENTALTIATFALVYILVTACSLPGATILTLLAGALFGTLVGTIIVSFASTLGASIAFLVSRFLLRDWVQKSFGDKLSAINNGISREGGFYLFTLRLIPLFPFFVINLVMGLTPLKLVSFFWVSQLGMLPGTIVYVNAGTQLGQLQSLEGILDGGLILSFVLLGLFPLAAKQVLAAIKRKRAFGKYRSPKNCDYNVVVIGAGSGGLVASYICSAIRAKVALIEKHRMGGDCLNTGCVPSKALIKSAKILSYAKRASEFGFSKAHFDFEFSEVMERIQSVIRKVAPHDSIERYTQLGVDCYQGTAKILTPFEVEVGGKTLTTRNIIVATGGSPAIPSLPGIERVGYFTSDTIWGLRKLPKRMLVLGGGPIGCELAQCFQRFGSSVVQVQSGPRILPREDDEIADLIMSQFRRLP